MDRWHVDANVIKDKLNLFVCTIQFNMLLFVILTGMMLLFVILSGMMLLFVMLTGKMLLFVILTVKCYGLLC